MKFYFIKQQDSMDCGATCLKMVCRYYGKQIPLQRLRSLSQTNKLGASLLGLNDAAEYLGFECQGIKIPINELTTIKLPCILHWTQSHFVVLYKIINDKYYLADPSIGNKIVLTKDQFQKKWADHVHGDKGVALLLKPTQVFYSQEEEVDSAGWKFIVQYFLVYKKYFSQILLGMAVGTLFSLITPLLTQAIVDVGIGIKDIGFVYLFLFAQLMLFVGSVIINFIRSWMMLHITTRVNVSILSNFLVKLMKLPVIFFESKTTGDIIQRLSDQQRIESFLTGTALNAVFSIINLFVFSFILAFYNIIIFWVFLISSVLYLGWIVIFLKRRRELNYIQFENGSSNSNIIVEMVNGMQEIKVNNCEEQKRWQWEKVQVGLFNFRIKSLSLNQYQQAGAMAINQGKNILITFLSVKGVIDGHLTLGGMMAIQYIIGQLNSPIDQLIGFTQSYQDAKISLERLTEVHKMEDEQVDSGEWISEIPENKNIHIKNLSFNYLGTENRPVLNQVNLQIPQGKTTAIVGSSGSGKTTLLKLLLRFYEPKSGSIHIGELRLSNLNFKTWRRSCGIVMQDGYIFSDTILNNIIIDDKSYDQNRLEDAIDKSNIRGFIDTLPQGVYTKIGMGGTGISQGQKQRLLIARAIYKNPEFVFFDEATNALDATNEKIIMHNLREFFSGRTVVIVAHRLSTVMNADNIIVLDNGKVVEQGNHYELTSLKGGYYNLVKDQLDLSA